MDKKKKEQGIVESFLTAIPIVGNFFKALAKTEEFQTRLKEADEKIKENLKTGEKRTWHMVNRLSIRPIRSNHSIWPILNKLKSESSELVIKDDYFYGKKGNSATLAIKVPVKDANVVIQDKKVIVTAKEYKKEIELPDYFTSVKKKTYKNGILLLELKK